ncbi:eukaryotic translation initiation factor 4G-like [Pyrus ussuriensis x Pyrus communis]|uniref:Eukaryotic translation initiation factor 4G-like n=1 Tax=Pyrus ussuriensis x Pyrus communis TaxID=2448454 RepID=A0A5N5GGH0_9ROSA|nr:eukaryotic translation initiation factor 4G-like [Pyrus ussuriensis x Pyrus communis]
MSFNQSTSDKNETRYRKTGRSASSNQQHRGYAPAYPKGTGAAVSVTSVSPQVSGMVPAQRGDVQNGAHNSQPQLHGGSDVPIASTAPQTADALAPQRCSRIVPKPPTSQSVSVTSDTRKPTTPAKPPGDASKGVAFQRGFISPGFMNEMQPQMGPQIPQMGNLGISMASQCPQQLGRKYGGPRKIPVKITHPDTHEELRLDKRTDSYPDGGPSAPRTHPNIPPQSQPIPSFAHPHTTTGYYANSYNPSPLYYPAPSSHPLTSSHMPPNSQARRFSYPGSQASQHVPFINPSSHSTLPVSKSGSLVHNVLDPPNLEHARDVRNISASVPSATGPVVIKPPAGTVGQKVVDPLPNSSTVVEKGELSKPLRQSGEIMQSAGDQSILKSLRVMEKVSASATATASVEKQVSNLLSSSSDAPTEESVPVVTTTEPRRIIDRQEGAARLHHRGSGMMDNDRWNKGGAANFRTGQVPNFGVLRNPHAPKLETSDTGEQVRGADDSDKDGHEHGAKKYSRDFLLKFSVQYTELPEGFEIMSDIAQILNANVNAAPSIYYDSLPSPGRIVDRQGGAARLDRRGSGIMDYDRWNKGGAANFRTGQVPNFGVLRNPHAPKLETSDTGEQVRGADDSDKDGHEHGAKKYSRDFLLKFSVQHTELPEGFEIMSDIEQILNANVNAAPSIYYDSLPSPGRIVDRQGGAARLDRRGSGIMDDDRWNMGGAANFRTGQGPNFGVLRNPRAPTPVQQHVRGILPGPANSVGHQGGMQRNNSDADRWQRSANFQPKGLMPSPHTPLQVMHKADRKYEVGKVSDEEQAKQRQLKAILNKLTPQNFEKLFEQVKAVNIDNATTLTGVISQIFDKALMEPTFCEMYANFCFYLAGELPDFSEDNEKITFKILLYNKCQEEFERGGREQEETNKADEEGQVKQSEEEREGKRIKARRQRLGNVSLIGELYKKRMLTERIMHKCIEKLFGQQQTPDEQDIEALCKLMSTIGEMIDHPKAKEYMDAYFERMKSLSNNMKLSSRVRFMLNDAIDLRKKKWQQRRKVEGRIKIEEVHIDAAQERQAESSRLVRGPGINPSARRGPPSPRGSTMLSSPNVHSFDRTLPTSPPTHAYGVALTQNVPSENVLTEDRLRDMSLAAIREFYSARDEKEVALRIKELNSPSSIHR